MKVNSNDKLMRRRRGRRGGRRTRRRGNRFITMRIPFIANVDCSNSTAKFITAGDLKLDLTRPLRALSCRMRGILLSGSVSSVTVILGAVADGQEGAVSRPVTFTQFPTSISVRQLGMMDFGKYGIGGELFFIQHTAATCASACSAPILSVSGTCVVQYLNSAALQVVKLDYTDPTSKYSDQSREAMSLKDFECATPASNSVSDVVQ